jgi:enolase-phosphatase E1
VTTSLRDAGIRSVLLDIEGTTTPIAFVHDVLFPHARARVREWLAAHPPSDPEIAEIVDGLRREYDAETNAREHPARQSRDWDLDATVERVYALMDQDRKSHALKLLQGRIWQEGYASGALKSDVYPDVPDALRRWTGAGIGVGIFSSGSVLAQRMLFAHSNAGDLTPFLRWYFDTGVGPKVESESYRRIARTIGAAPGEILFVSDVARELDAARQAGLQTRLAVRAPAERPASADHPIVETFDEIG